MRDLPTRSPARFTEAGIGMLGTWSQFELGQSNGASSSPGHCTVQPQREPCCLGGGGEERQAPRGQALPSFRPDWNSLSPPPPFCLWGAGPFCRAW